jgi:hypothetical protein
MLLAFRQKNIQLCVRVEEDTTVSSQERQKQERAERRRQKEEEEVRPCYCTYL